MAQERLIRRTTLLLFFLLSTLGSHRSVAQEKNAILLTGPDYRIRIHMDGFRYGFEAKDGRVLAPPHATSGLQFGPVGAAQEVTQATLISRSKEGATFRVQTASGRTARVDIQLVPHRARFSVSPEGSGPFTIVGRTGGVGPAFGLGDHAGYGRPKLELTGYRNDQFSAGHKGGGEIRMVSNFVVFPRQGLASINVEPRMKVVRVTADENAQGVYDGSSMPALYYFFGTPQEIYREFLDIRNEHGYKIYKPKYEFFGVGWEAWGALAWDTNARTVREDVTRFLDEGYPLRWMVIGSGFWPRHDDALKTTTTFGQWDPQLYPDPKGLIDYFHGRGLKFMLGLRIDFMPGGPFTQEGYDKGYFIKKDGKQGLFKVGFPKVPIYLLDTLNPEALDWYIGLTHKWLDYGVDGFKEDLYGYHEDAFERDDRIDAANERMMDEGVYVMGRNAYLGSPADIHRYNDFNYNQNQDRGPLNGLALAFSGFPYVYPDIVGGTLAQSEFGAKVRTILKEEWTKQYVMRMAWYSALNPSMAMGFGPWNWNDEEVSRVTRDAARFHERLLPYIYDAALDTYETGFPYTMTPLPLAYPDEAGVYSLADTTKRQYEWLIGESLLATPLYGNDYARASTRDVYLPKGTWFDYDTGRKYTGPATLKSFSLPVDKTPLFVGGKGIVIEQNGDQLLARVYPVGSRNEMEYTHRDGRKTHIQVTNRFDPARRVRVTDDKNHRISAKVDRGAIVFDITPGASYRVQP